MTDHIQPAGDRGRLPASTILTIGASLVAVVSLTYAITTAALPRRVEVVEQKVEELRIGRVETNTKLDALIKSVDQIQDALTDNPSQGR